MSLLRGRFGEEVSDLMDRFSSSIQVDLPLAEDDIDGSIAHARMLGKVGILSPEEVLTISDGLNQIREELGSGKFQPASEDEDIHMAVESRLIQLTGDVGKKLHTARSRNDQIATDVRLWLKRKISRLDDALTHLIRVMISRVKSDGQVLLPGYTHLQRGQPIRLGHQLLSHGFSLLRDRARLRDAMTRVDLSPLGACAMAGTPHPIDREMTASELGFSGVMENAMDAVAARDHEQEVVSACAISSIHLSRMAQELVLWSSREFDFVALSFAWTTGSSIMPQKRNPDAAELVRGKSATVCGDLMTLLCLVKGLPLAYNRDLQEDRAPLYHAIETTLQCVEVMAGMWSDLVVKKDRFTKELFGDFSLATEIADHLVLQGVSFRDAHKVVGALVLWCEENQCLLHEVPRDVAAGIHPSLDIDLTPLLDPEASVERRCSKGGTASSEVKRQVELLEEKL